MKEILLCAKHEYRKVLLFSKGWLFVLICFILHTAFCLLSQPNLYEYAFDTKLYQNYIEQYGGTYSQNIAEQIDEELENQQELANMPLELEVLSSEDYLYHSNQIAIARNKVSALQALKEKYATLEHLHQYNAELVYDIEFLAYSKQFKQDWPALICIVIMTISIVFGDMRCGMTQLLYSSKVGKSKVLKGKIICVGTLAMCIALIFSFSQVGMILGRWDFGELHAAIQSCTGFEECTLRISIFDSLVLGCIIKILFSVMFAFLLALFSLVLKNEVLGISMIAVIVGGGILHKSSGTLVQFNLSAYLSGVSSITQMTFARLIITLLISIVILTALILSVYKVYYRT